MKLSSHHKGVLALIISAIIWGAATPILKKSLETISPFSMAFLRFIIASLIILPFAAKFKIRINKSHLPQIIKASFFGITLNIGLLFFGAKLTTGLHIAIITALYPILNAVAAKFTLKEKLNKRIITGMLLGLFGAVIIIGEPLFEIGSTYKSDHLIGDILIILSTIAWVAYTIENKELDKLKNYHPFEILPFSFLIGVVTFLPFAVFELVQHPFWTHEVSNFAKFGLIYYGIFSSFVAYFCFTYGLSKTTATEAGITSYLIPILSIILSIPILGEKITSYFLTGSALIALGILVTEIKHLPSCFRKNK